MTIRAQIVKAMEQGVQSVINGKTKKFKCYGVSPQMIRDYMLNINYSRIEEMETNGWQYDWWILVEATKSFLLLVVDGHVSSLLNRRKTNMVIVFLFFLLLSGITVQSQVAYPPEYSNPLITYSSGNMAFYFESPSAYYRLLR